MHVPMPQLFAKYDAKHLTEAAIFYDPCTNAKLIILSHVNLHFFIFLKVHEIAALNEADHDSRFLQPS